MCCCGKLTLTAIRESRETFHTTLTMSGREEPRAADPDQQSGGMGAATSSASKASSENGREKESDAVPVDVAGDKTENSGREESPPPTSSSSSSASSVSASTERAEEDEPGDSAMPPRKKLRRTRSAKKAATNAQENDPPTDEINPNDPDPRSDTEENEEDDVDDDKGVAFVVKEFDLGEYNEQEIMITIDQIVIPDYKLRITGMPHVNTMANLLRRDGYRTSTGVLSVTVRKSLNEHLAGTKLEDITTKSGHSFFPTLNADVKADVVDGLHRHRAWVRMKSGVQPERWLSEPLRVVLVNRKDGQDMTGTEILRHSALRNHRSSAVKKDEHFIDFIYSVMSYIQSIAKDHGFDPLNIKVTDLAKSMKAATYLHTSSYLRYARIGKCLLRVKDAVNNLLEYMGNLPTAQRGRLGPTHIDTEFFHQTKDSDEAWFFLEALVTKLLDPVVTKGSKSTIFPTKHFYKTATIILNFLRDLYGEFKDDGETFSVFLNREFSLSHVKKQKIREYGIHLLRNTTATKVGMAQSQKSCARMELKIREELSGVIEVPVTKKKKKKRHASPSLQPPPRAKRNRRKPATFEPEGTSAPLTRVSKTKKARKVQVIDSSTESSDSDTESNEPGSYETSMSALANARFPRENFVGSMYPDWTATLSCPPHLLLQNCPSEVKQFRVPALTTAHIPEEHRAFQTVAAEDIMSLHRCVWYLGYKNGEPSFGLKDISAETATPEQFMLRSSTYFSLRKAEIDHRGYSILEGFADHSTVPEEFWKRKDSDTEFAAFGNVMESFGQIGIQHVLNTFNSIFKEENDKEKAHNKKEEQMMELTNQDTYEAYVRTLFRPIVNTGYPDQDEKDKARGEVRFQSSQACVTSHIEGKQELRWLVERKALLDVWLGLLACALGISNSEKGPKCWLPASGGRFLITNPGCKRQTAHNDFPHDKYRPGSTHPGYFVMVSGEQPFPIWVMPGSHDFCKYTEWRRCAVGVFSQMEKIIVPKHSVFIGHGLLTHAGAGWEDRISSSVYPRYHIYLRPEHVEIVNSVYYALGGIPSYFNNSGPPSPPHELFDVLMEPFNLPIKPNKPKAHKPLDKESLEKGLEDEQSDALTDHNDISADEEQPAFDGGDQQFDEDDYLSDSDEENDE